MRKSSAYLRIFESKVHHRLKPEGVEGGGRSLLRIEGVQTSLINVNEMDIIRANEARKIVAQCAIVRVLEGQSHQAEEERGVASTVAIDIMLESRITRTILVG